MYGQLVNTSMSADQVKSSGSGGHEKYQKGELHTPDGKTYEFTESVDYSLFKPFEKDRLLELKAQGWQSTIRAPQIDKATGLPRETAEYDHLVFSFSAEESRALKENPELIQAFKNAFVQAATSSCNGQPGKKMALILDPHDDTAHLHFHAYIHRHPVDVENKIIGRSEELHKASMQAAFLQHLNNVLVDHGLQKASDLRDVTGRGLFVDRAPAKAEAQTAVAEAIHDAGGVAVMRADARSFSELTPEIDKISKFEAQRRAQAERLQAEINRMTREMQAATDDVLLAQNAMAALERDAIQQAKIIELETEKDNVEENLNQLTYNIETLTTSYNALVVERDSIAKQNEDYLAKNNDLANEVNMLKEHEETIKKEYEEEITELTDNHTFLIDKINEDNNKIINSYKNEIEAIKANNILLAESLAALKENNELLKQSLMNYEKENAKLEEDIENIKDFNYKLDIENDKLRKNNDEMSKDVDWMNKKIKELKEQNEEYDLIIKKQTDEITKKMAEFDEYIKKSRANDYVIPLNNNIPQNNDYIKTMEYRKLKYAGMKDEDNRMTYPVDFMNMPLDTKKEIALDMAIASTIRWGNNWSINCENKELKAFLEDFRKQNQDIINKRVNEFNEQNKPKTELKTDNKPNEETKGETKTIKKTDDELFDEHYKNMLKTGILNDLESAKQMAEGDELMKKVIERFENEQNNESDIKGLGEK